MTTPLAGSVVVVTRPERQADRFLDLLRGRGADPLAFPTIAIEPVRLAPAERQALLARGPFDWIVYTSANAVEHGMAELGQPAGARAAAIGRATARALIARGLRVHALPESGSDSEGLLALPEFTRLAGRRVLIVKGVGGRDALRAGLAARGAEVAQVEVYRRVRAVPTGGALRGLQEACESDRDLAVAVTSVEVLESLLALAPPAALPRLLDAGLLVPGERVAAAARRLGWRGALIVARSAEDEAMLEALVDRRPAGSTEGPA